MTVATSPIAIVPRGSLSLWRSLGSFEPVQGMSGAAERVVTVLRERGALFFVEIVQTSGLLRVQVEEALGELIARGVVTADSFASCWRRKRRSSSTASTSANCSPPNGSTKRPPRISPRASAVR